MPLNADPEMGINSWLEDELYQQYLRDRTTVDASWKEVFESLKARGSNGTKNAPVVMAGLAPAPEPGEAEPVQPLRGAAGRIAENMTASLSIPLATSQRVIAVKVMDENRRIINQHRAFSGGRKVSFTHLIGWAIVKALADVPNLNHAYGEKDGQPLRILHPAINLGIAVDVAGKDGARSLMVPNIKNAGSLNFEQYLNQFDDLVARARTNKLTPADFQGTTISLTNPGTVGTVASIPRLMMGQGAIIASGAIDYPAAFRGAAEVTRAALGMSKVMTLTCTYDHRIIQGAESGAFLGRVQALLDGKDGFYEELFAHLRMPHQPARWEADSQPLLFSTAARTADVAKQTGVIQMINAYRVRGHLIADLDPLGAEPSYHAELDPATYGLTIWDLDREFFTGSLGEAMGHGEPRPLATLREILEMLRQTYCGKIGAEYMNIQVPEQKRWLQLRMEPDANNWPLEKATRVRILRNLIEAEEFEHFLHSRFVGQKRFALEGGEAALAILEELLERASDNNVHEFVIGMAHRGRLNILVNVVGKDVKHIFSEFEGEIDPASTQGSGDVKYHLGATGVRKFESGKEIVVSVSPNPSHLEAVDPVVEGIVRPKQDRLGDTARERVIPLLIHGDAAFAGQGVVAETLNLSQLEGYWTGGTVHLVINNQIGFTTLPEGARSTPYSTDVARGVQAPIFHVNGDDPEAAIRAAEMAFDYRQRFKKDVVIDMVCYRRHGHNEADDPSYTQPILYRKIKEHPSVAVLYGERLVREGVVSAEEVQGMRKAVSQRLSDAYDASQKHAERYELQELSAVPSEEIGSYCPKTSVTLDAIEQVIEGSTVFPADFHLHPKLRGYVDRRRDAIEKDRPVDWAFGEALAFGTLVLEGTPVRLSGQDSGRGTFSQRHLAFYDSETGKRYVPMQHLSADQARFDVFDSSLSEYAVLGFEFGYSVADPLTLVIWEAQFGDFANGAQIMIDQFVSSAESKWGQPSGLVMLLPHGYEGQGPEHSSARIERYLSLCAENNMQVVNCTTPAQYFHVLRRQMHGGLDRRGTRKPLIIFTPKSLLRQPRAVSHIHDFTAGGFSEIIPDSLVPDNAQVSRVVFCSGKIYYDLLQGREGRKADYAALVRVEQLYPFAADQARDILARYPVTAEVVWAQEEPRNMGAWRFMREAIRPLLEETRRELRYVGRAEGSSPATGSGKRHQQEQAEIVNDALTPGAISQTRRVRVVARRKK
ncbi:MAG TPA: multifunctional oxoglutarate decarboxylase/oxoglutarate dehydrogenase thiamine pyrophosphate-binding subunit/dihydrolipoyllysine-residue succinyltransferase subunit [Bryobacteraceae bacterium]|nr:multifunctional oxoglutarate decarboxylase/oxoglutarate dehydrogenase thiamine pyrophosphate-binding subunit/dihydrolipoyllysine-residue succinyltransferase subunit [Bryobacteraceae bacterium]